MSQNNINPQCLKGSNDTIMNKIFNYSFLLMLLLVFSQCRKDEITPINGESILDDAENVSFLIQIIDEKNNGIPNATLTIKGVIQPLMSDNNGFVFVDKLTIPNAGLLTTVTANFYHKQIKLLNGASNSKNTKFIKMVSDGNFHTIATGTESYISNGGKLKLPEVLLLPDGSPYKGNVNVKNNYFDPDEKDFLLAAPGNMLGLDANNNFTTLASLGMYRIELFTPNGEPLKIKAGEKALLSFPIADIHKGKVGNTIPLWYFNEETGLWVREGQALLNNDYMVAEVSHFSIWNCDLFFDFVELCFTLKTPDGTPVNGVILSFNLDQFFPVGFDQTNDEGKVCGRIPLDKPIRIDVLINNTLVQSFDVGPFSLSSADVELILTNKIIEVKGKAVSCDMNPVSNGFGFAKNSNGGYLLQVFNTNSDGSFSYFTSSFDQKLTLVNLDDAKTKIVELNAPQLDNDVDLGLLSICDGTLVSSISGKVWIDEDEDGTSDVPYEFRTVVISQFTSTSSFYQEVQTDWGGNYSLILPPGDYQIAIPPQPNDQYSVIASGDLSSDGTTINEIDEGILRQYSPINCTVDLNEQDENNDFQLSPKGIGTLSGKIMIDLDNDGIGDKTAEGIKVNFGDIFNTSVCTNENGAYKSDNDLQNYLGTINIGDQNWYGLYNDGIIRSVDESPDPDGDDSSQGANLSIPIRLKRNEIDADNNFVFWIARSKVVCRVLADTNNDGVGDTPLIQQKVELYYRNVAGTPTITRVGEGSTNEAGYFVFHGIEPGEYVIYYLGDGNYTAINNIDLIPDNNPVNPSGDAIFRSVDIVGKEYDDGNTFIVKKN